MRTFTLGSGTGRKFVVLEVNGPRVGIIESQPDGSTKRSEKELKCEADARTVCERMARALLDRGFVEQTAAGPTKAKPQPAAAAKPATAPKPAAAPKPAVAAKPAAAKPVAAPKPAARVPDAEPINASYLLDDDAEPVVAAAPLLPRMAAPAAEAAPKKKKKAGGKKKKGKKGPGDDGLDKRVIAAVVAGGAAFVAFLGFLVYDIFLKPPSIVGNWQGTRIEHEIGRYLTRAEYALILDDQHHAQMSVQGGDPEVGTYTVKGDLLTLTFKGEEGEPSQRQYKISLGRATLDLYDPSSGKKLVQLIRFREPASVGGKAKVPEPPKDLAGGDVNQADKAADDRLAKATFSPKDGAFKIRPPKGWETETGSRPDNLYSWARFTHDSAKIQVFADATGSLMSGSNVGQNYPEGSELAPVHNAHMLYKKTISEEYSDYNESAPTLFKGAGLGEGRIAAFTASTGGLFGSKVRGYRVTLLTNDRRITVLCECPPGDFAGLKPLFLAVARSASY